MKNICFIILMCIFLSGCGFKLRGNYTMPDYLQQIKVLPDSPYTPLQRKLRSELIRNKVDIQPVYSKKKIYTLHILNSNFIDEILSRNIHNQAGKIKLYLTVNYKITDCNNNLVNNNLSVTASREFLLSHDTVLSSENERNKLQTELINEVVYKILRQLSRSQ